jgi:type IV pilus assembly protein PilB
MAEAPPLLIPTEADEIAHAQALARRYRCDFIDLKNFRIQTEVIRSVPVDIMFRYNFLPLEALEDRLVIAVASGRLMC